MELAGFLKDRRIGENIDLATAVLEYLEDGGADGTGGVLLLADQAKAFDSVQHDFLDGTLHAFGFPDEFRGIVRTLYNGARTTVKVNGKLGQPFTISAGLRQGCCASPQLYLIVQEVLLRMIRNDTRLRGVRAPGPNGSTSPEHAVELRGRCFADDLMVYLADVDAYVHLRDNLLAPFNRASGHAINFDKTYAIMAGQQAERIGQPHTRTRPSLESVDGDVKFRSLATFDGEYHGVKLGTAAQKHEEWQALEQQVKEHLRRAQPRQKLAGVHGRMAYVHTHILSKAWWPMEWTAPPIETMDEIHRRMQKDVNASITAAGVAIKYATLTQPKEDLGVGVVDVHAKVTAQHAARVATALNTQRKDHPEDHFVRHALARAYGTWAGELNLIRANYSFQLLLQTDGVPAWIKSGFRALGKLQPAQPQATATDTGWDDEPLFFNPWITSARSSLQDEQTAAQWGAAGVSKVAHLKSGPHRYLTPQQFKARHPDLSQAKFTALVKVLQERKPQPPPPDLRKDKARAAPLNTKRKRGAATTTTRSEEANGAAAAPEPAPPPEIPWPAALMNREPVLVTDLDQGTLQAMAVARDFTVPRAFDTKEKDVRYAAEYPGLSDEQYLERLRELAAALNRRTYVSMHLRDVDLRTHLCFHTIGGHKGQHALCAACAQLGQRSESTMMEALLRCPSRASPLLQRVAAAWEEITGEDLDHTSARVWLLGDRTPAGDAAADTPPLQHERVFQTLRLCVLRRLQEEHREDERRARGGAARSTNIDQLYGNLRRELAQEVRNQWARAKASTDTHAKTDFWNEWMHAGFAAFRRKTAKSQFVVHLLNPLPAPPTHAHAAVYHTDGAGARERGPNQAGWGFAGRLTGTQDEPEIWAACGRVVGGTPTERSKGEWLGADDPTSNSGELTAVLKAVQHAAAEQPADRPCHFHIDSMLALRAAWGRRQRPTRPRKGERVEDPRDDPNASLEALAEKHRHAGTYEKKHKVLHRNLAAAVAGLVRQRGAHRVRFYKVKGHSGDTWNDLADRWAGAGRDGCDEGALAELTTDVHTAASAERDGNIAAEAAAAAAAAEWSSDEDGVT